MPIWSQEGSISAVVLCGSVTMQPSPQPSFGSHIQCHMLYHMVVGRREVLVQLDDDLVERLDRLAQAQNTSRSELLRRGAAAVIEAAEQLDADRLLRDAYRRVPQDPALVASARRLAVETAPEW
jgi:hypothetical protein